MDLLARCNGYRPYLFVVAALALTVAGCEVASQPYDYIHLPGTEPEAGANMPFPSAIRVRSGSILFLSGTVGAPSCLC